VYTQNKQPPRRHWFHLGIPLWWISTL